MSTLETKDIITACIAIVSIISSVTFTIINLYLVGKNTRLKNKRDAIIKYYMPILYALTPLSIEYDKAKLKNQLFDIFNPNMESKESQRDRINIIQNHYSSFIRIEMKFEHQFCDKELDIRLYSAIKHMTFMTSFLGSEMLVDLGMAKKEYPVPNFQQIINLLETTIGLETVKAKAHPKGISMIAKSLRKMHNYSGES